LAVHKSKSKSKEWIELDSCELSVILAAGSKEKNCYKHTGPVISIKLVQRNVQISLVNNDYEIKKVKSFMFSTKCTKFK